MDGGNLAPLLQGPAWGSRHPPYAKKSVYMYIHTHPLRVATIPFQENSLEPCKYSALAGRLAECRHRGLALPSTTEAAASDPAARLPSTPAASSTAEGATPSDPTAWLPSDPAALLPSTAEGPAPSGPTSAFLFLPLPPGRSSLPLPLPLPFFHVRAAFAKVLGWDLARRQELEHTPPKDLSRVLRRLVSGLA